MANEREPMDAPASLPESWTVHSRRAVLVAGVGFLLAGCASAGRASRLPGPAWDAARTGEVPVYHPPDVPSAPPSAGMGGVRSRAEWAGGAPVPSLMNRMKPIRLITVHHDGMSPFTAGDPRAGAARIESIRRAHRANGWGDIGYHFAIDRSGAVWEGRPLGWQGAHVKDHNEGNIGVVCLGNFEQQTPTEAQLAALRAHVRRLMQQYRVSIVNLKTHRELGPTVCPGRNLQSYMVASRARGVFG